MKAIRITQNGDASVLQVQSLPQPIQFDQSCLTDNPA